MWVKFGVGNVNGVGDVAPGRVHEAMLDASMSISSKRADFCIFPSGNAVEYAANDCTLIFIRRKPVSTHRFLVSKLTDY